MSYGQEEFRDWFTAVESHTGMSTHFQMGYAKIAFTYAFKYLLNGDEFEQSISNFPKNFLTLNRGYDWKRRRH
jgi:hypothetical protein